MMEQTKALHAELMALQPWQREVVLYTLGIADEVAGPTDTPVNRMFTAAHRVARTSQWDQASQAIASVKAMRFPLAQNLGANLAEKLREYKAAGRWRFRLSSPFDPSTAAMLARKSMMPVGVRTDDGNHGNVEAVTDGHVLLAFDEVKIGFDHVSRGVVVGFIPQIEIPRGSKLLVSEMDVVGVTPDATLNNLLYLRLDGKVIWDGARWVLLHP